MIRPLLVGACPPPGTTSDRHSPLFPYPPNCAGDRLRKITGLGRNEYLRSFDRINLVADPGFSDKWDKEIARMCAVNLMRGGLLRDRSTILLGAQVHQAFGVVWTGNEQRGLPELVAIRRMQWIRLPIHYGDRGSRVLLLPHPSGRNQIWNNVWVRRKARRRLMEAINGDEAWRLLP